MNIQKSNLVIIGLVLIIIAVLIKNFSWTSWSWAISLMNKPLSWSLSPNSWSLSPKKFVCPDVGYIKKEVVYDSCIKRFSDFDLTEGGGVRKLYTKESNPFIYDIYTHIYTYIIGSLLLDDFFIGESDSFGTSKFLWFAFYEKYYSIKNPENKKEAINLLNTLNEAYSQSKTIETKYPFIDIFYNWYLWSMYYPKREYLKYFNSILSDCAKTWNCKNLEPTFFTDQLIFFYYYLNNIEIVPPDNVCEEFTCSYLQKRFYE